MHYLSSDSEDFLGFDMEPNGLKLILKKLSRKKWASCYVRKNKNQKQTVKRCSVKVVRCRAGIGVNIEDDDDADDLLMPMKVQPKRGDWNWWCVGKKMTKIKRAKVTDIKQMVTFKELKVELVRYTPTELIQQCLENRINKLSF